VIAGEVAHTVDQLWSVTIGGVTGRPASTSSSDEVTDHR